MMVTICQNIFHQIFEESVSVKISPHQNFPLYSNLHILCNKVKFVIDSHGQVEHKNLVIQFVMDNIN